MSTMRFMRIIGLLCGLAIVALCFSGGTLLAQERPGSNPTGAEAKLTPQQRAGQNLYLQHCSACHSSRNLKFGKPPSVGANLKGAFKDLPPDEEKQMTDFILKGGPHMPGFQYTFSAKDMDALVAYLKTM